MRFKGTTNTGGTATQNPLRESRELLEQAEGLRKQGKLDRAESILSSLVRRYPDYFGAQHTLGLVYADKSNYRAAVYHLVQAAMLNPRSWMTHTALAGVYLRLDAKEMAARTLELARTIKPREPAVLATLGEVYSEEREYELARDAYREALAVDPGMTEAAIGLGYANTALGRYGEATETLESLLQRGERSLGVLTSLVGLPASAIRCDILSELDKVVQRGNEKKADFDTDVAFIRTAALDMAGRHREAWEQATAANRAMRAKTKDELARHIRQRDVGLKWLQDNSIKPKPHAPGDEKHPISLFILGPTRSGKTSLEALTARLDGVVRGYENPAVENSISRAYQTAGLLTTWTLDHLPPQFHPVCREIYIEELTRRAPSARVFTNTHPAYIYDAARIAAVFPNIRFVFLKRNVEDNLLRTYLRKYGKGNSYSYDLRAAHEHIVWYNQMIDTLAEKLPSIARVIHYEDMVHNPAGALRTAAEMCDLSMLDGPLPVPGNDIGCSNVYREFMNVELES